MAVAHVRAPRLLSIIFSPSLLTARGGGNGHTIVFDTTELRSFGEAASRLELSLRGCADTVWRIVLPEFVKFSFRGRLVSESPHPDRSRAAGLVAFPIESADDYEPVGRRVVADSDEPQASALLDSFRGQPFVIPTEFEVLLGQDGIALGGLPYFACFLLQSSDKH